MKKKLEADLISIAHRVLQMKNKSDIDQLFVETQKLYEKLSVLRFVESHFENAKPTIGAAEIIEKLDQNLPLVAEHVAVIEKETQEIIEEKIEKEEIITLATTEDAIEEVKEEIIPQEVEMTTIIEEVVPEKNIDFEVTAMPEPVSDAVLPSFEMDEIIEIPKKNEAVQISFEDLLGGNFDETHFVKVDHTKEKANQLDFELPKINLHQEVKPEIVAETQQTPKFTEPKSFATIEKQVAGINIGLNDRIAFVKHLFGNSNEDYNRVLNQIITFDSFEEAQNFIEDMVKPDYNNWTGKEDYSERFIQIIEKKFA